MFLDCLESLEKANIAGLLKNWRNVFDKRNEKKLIINKFAID